MAGFLDRVVAFVAGEFPGRGRDGRSGTAGRDNAGSAERLRYGLKTEQELVSFLLAAKEFGSDFDQRRAARSVLTAPISPAEKALFLDCLVLLGSSRSVPVRRVA